VSRHLNLSQSVIRLPDVTHMHGLRAKKFVVVPGFGWFIVQRDGVIRNLGDLLSPSTAAGDLEKMLESYTNRRDRELSKRLDIQPELAGRQFLLRRGYELFHRTAHDAFNRQPVPHDPAGRSWRDIHLQSGDRQVDQLRLGWVSPEVFQRFAPILRLDPRLQGRLLLPSWVSPQHICSLEAFDHGRMIDRETIYQDYEPGWYGQPEGEIVEQPEELLRTPGCTWDHKLEYWVPPTDALKLSGDRNTRFLLRVWLESPVRLTTTPIIVMFRETGKQVELPDLVGLMFPGEAAWLGERLNLPLLKALEARPPTYHPYSLNQVIADHRTHYRIAHGPIDRAEKLRYQQISNFTLRQYMHTGGRKESIERVGLIHLNRNDAVLVTSHQHYHRQGEHLLRQLTVDQQGNVIADPWIQLAFRKNFFKIIDAMWHPRLGGLDAEQHRIFDRCLVPYRASLPSDPYGDRARRAKILFRRIEQQDGRIEPWTNT
jgi:hypothetical protein